MTASNGATGAVTFKVGAIEYRMAAGFSALCEIEEEFDQPAMTVIEQIMPKITAADALDPEKMKEATKFIRMSVIRRVLKAMLNRHHVEIGIDEVDEIADALGMPVLIGHMQKALMRAAPVPGDGANANPQPTRTKSRRK